ncbi:MAG: dCTP deaminase domain-containing protein [Candidatus Hodarchaeales archaeon]|jgi:deoxycytidine triphosphate deaminase
MIVNPHEWKQFVQHLFEKNVQHTSIDFSLDKLYMSTGQIPEFLAGTKKVEDLTELIEFHLSPLKLEPGNYYVGVTREKFKPLPLQWSALVIPKSSTYGGGGLNVISGWIDPGFDSYLRFGIQVLNPFGVIVEKGSSLIQVVVFNNGFTATSYDGYWKDEKSLKQKLPSQQ